MIGLIFGIIVILVIDRYYRDKIEEMERYYKKEAQRIPIFCELYQLGCKPKKNCPGVCPEKRGASID